MTTKESLINLKLIPEQSLDSVIDMLIKEHDYNIQNGTALVLSKNVKENEKLFKLSSTGKIEVLH